MSDSPESLRWPQSQALRSTLIEVLEFAERAGEILDEERRAGFPALTAAAAAEIEVRVRDLESAARGLMEHFRLRAAERNARGELRAYASRTWADLLDCRSGAMRRFGPPPAWYGERLDPRIEKMAALAHEIVYFAREPESE